MRHCIPADRYFTLSTAEALLSIPAPDLNRIRTLLFAAFELPPADRRAFVDREAAEEVAVRAELIELLILDPLAAGFLIGALLDDRYEIESVMAESGFATVYLARDTAVARKRVDHHAVVGVSDTGLTEAGFPYLVLAFVPGVSLRELMGTGLLGRERSIALLKGLARALAIAHRAGVARLDVKPENIIISDPGMDEERATLLDSRLRSANEGIQAGSLRYMAPEQLTNPSASCDVYSLGVIAKEMRGLPRSVQRLLDRRYPSAVEFATALDEATRPPRRMTFFPNLPRTVRHSRSSDEIPFKAMLSSSRISFQEQGPKCSLVLPGLIATVGGPTVAPLSFPTTKPSDKPRVWGASTLPPVPGCPFCPPSRTSAFTFQRFRPMASKSPMPSVQLGRPIC